MIDAKRGRIWASVSVLIVLTLALFVHLQDGSISSASTAREPKSMQTPSTRSLNGEIRFHNIMPQRVLTDSINVAESSTASTSIPVVSVQGRIGPAGLPGKTGQQGSVGATGIQGLTGATGLQGTVGASGPQGVAGVAGSQGSVGATGSQGPAGATGSQGPAGEMGPQGPAGSGPPDGYIEQEFCYQEKTLAITFGKCTESGINLIWLISNPKR